MEGCLGDFPFLHLAGDSGVPSGRAFSWLLLAHFSPGRVLRHSLGTQYLGPVLSCSVWTLGGQVEAKGELCRGEDGGEEPRL